MIYAMNAIVELVLMFCVCVYRTFHTLTSSIVLYLSNTFGKHILTIEHLMLTIQTMTVCHVTLSSEVKAIYDSHTINIHRMSHLIPHKAPQRNPLRP